jgi:cystathionine beta-lyase
MKYDFDKVIERKGTDSLKWMKYGDDVIPLWVADMDFPSAEPIIQALHHRTDHRIYGYTRPPQALRHVVRERLKTLYRWAIKDEDIVFLPSLVVGINLAYHVFSAPGEGVLLQPPVYHHFIRDPVHHGRVLNDPPLVQNGDSYEIDFAAFEKALTNQFLLCNPHNPVGRVFRRDELEKMAEICLRRNLIICSDEIHCDLLYPGYRHTPMATLCPEIANHTVTLMAPSKTFNLAGLDFGFAIIQNPTLRRKWQGFSQGLIPGVNIMGHVAALAAFKEGQEWLDQVLQYLTANRDFLAQYLKEKLPEIRMTKMEGTYLAWLDCRKAGIPGNPFEFFLREGKIAFNDGSEFGRGGQGFVRLNFACSRKSLTEALDRMVFAMGRR